MIFSAITTMAQISDSSRSSPSDVFSTNITQLETPPKHYRKFVVRFFFNIIIGNMEKMDLNF